jgi:hypothetical protein
MSRFLAAVLFASTLVAQNAVEGTVINDATLQPLRRAHVVLTPVAAGAESVGMDTDDRGAFSLRDVPVGRYTIHASRDGYVSSSDCMIGLQHLPRIFPVGEKQTITGLQFRLRPFAVMAGRVLFDDGEPAIGVPVVAYREARAGLRHRYQRAAQASTNDRGEYRMFGLGPGAYLVAAVYESPAPANEQRRDADAPRAATTFYPRALELNQASPVQLDYGRELAAIDIVLERVKKVTVRGHVMSGVSGMAIAATILLQQVDARGVAALAVPVAAKFDRDKRFEIRNVVPGNYLLWADGSDGGKALTGRIPITVGQFDIDDADVTVEGEHTGLAILHTDGAVTLGQTPTLRFEPRNERARIVNASSDAGGYRFALTGGETYDLYVENLPNDFYVSALLVNGADRLPFGVDGGAASVDKPFDVVLDSRGGSVSGRVTGPDDSLWSRAAVVLIPDPPGGRAQAYRQGATNENGVFQIHGIAPGRYILTAWLDEPPCDVYDADNLNGCRSAGIAVDVQQASQQNVELKMKTAAKR